MRFKVLYVLLTIIMFALSSGCVDSDATSRTTENVTTVTDPCVVLPETESPEIAVVIVQSETPNNTGTLFVPLADRHGSSKDEDSDEESDDSQDESDSSSIPYAEIIESNRSYVDDWISVINITWVYYGTNITQDFSCYKLKQEDHCIAFDYSQIPNSIEYLEDRVIINAWYRGYSNNQIDTFMLVPSSTEGASAYEFFMRLEGKEYYLWDIPWGSGDNLQKDFLINFSRGGIDNISSFDSEYIDFDLILNHATMAMSNIYCYVANDEDLFSPVKTELKACPDSIHVRVSLPCSSNNPTIFVGLRMDEVSSLRDQRSFTRAELENNFSPGYEPYVRSYFVFTEPYTEQLNNSTELDNCSEVNSSELLNCSDNVNSTEFANCTDNSSEFNSTVNFTELANCTDNSSEFNSTVNSSELTNFSCEGGDTIL